MKLVLMIFAIIFVFGTLHVAELYATVWPHTWFNQFTVALWLVLAVDSLADMVKRRG